MPTKSNPIVATYSELARTYDDASNASSCWGRLTRETAERIRLKETYRSVVDVGCGTGWALFELAKSGAPNVQFIGIDPAENMCQRTEDLVSRLPNVRVRQGSFENLPLDNASIDYLYSTLAFHWCTNLEQAVGELKRVLKRTGDMDLLFIGRDCGRDFIGATTPILLKYMGPALLVQSARLRKHLTLTEAQSLFREAFASRDLSVRESYQTYYDTVEGHWSWWVRVEGHLAKIPQTKRDECDSELKAAISRLGQGDRIPYTAHLLRVRVR